MLNFLYRRDQSPGKAQVLYIDNEIAVTIFKCISYAEMELIIIAI